MLYHGVLAPDSRWRRRVVVYEAPRAPFADSAGPRALGLRGDPPARTEPTHTLAGYPAPHQSVPGGESPPSTSKPRYWAWADLMRRAFDLDVLACPRCGGRMRLIATIEDPQVIRKLLAHLGLRTEVPRPRPPPVSAAALFADMHA